MRPPLQIPLALRNSRRKSGAAFGRVRCQALGRGLLVCGSSLREAITRRHGGAIRLALVLRDVASVPATLGSLQEPRED